MEEIYVGESDFYSECVSIAEMMYCYDIEEANNTLLESYAEEFPSGTV